MRLDKYLKHALCVSRSESADLIKTKRVKVNNNIVPKDYDVQKEDVVLFDDKTVVYKEFYYYMLNKPAGYVSSRTSNDGIPVTSLIKERNDLFPVGRLDKETEGLLILTNDGSLAHHLTSPKHNVEKKYYVQLENDIKEEDKVSFNNGVMIKVDGKDYKCLPSRLEIINKNSAYVFISEGKFHQVKEMFKTVGNSVIYLKRVKEGNLELDETLKIGEYRELTESEVSELKAVK